MAKFVRSSKYRHVFAGPPRKETVWDGVKLTKNAWDSNFVSVNPSWIAVSWQVGGGGAVGILNANTATKITDKVAMFTGHKGAIYDLEFSPFNDSLLATVSEDCYGKIWKIPDGGFEGPIDKEVQNLKGHQRKVGYVAWNPVAENVLATGGTDFAVKIWDVTTGDEKFSFAGHGGIINSINWSYDGSTLVSFAKDKKVRCFDPRQPGTAAEGNGHQGVKGGRALWLGKHDKIFTVGFGPSAERQYFIYDAKNLSTPLVGPVNIDSSAGVLMPFYDEDSDLLFLAGKGDGNIRYYEIEPEASPKPEVYFISQYASNEPTAAIGMMPKRGCDVNSNEIVKLFRVYGTKLEPLSFKVPRKSDLFQEDIFPDCRSDEPALTADQWYAGENSKPKTKSLQGGFVKREATSTNFQMKDDNEPVLSEADLKKENAELKKRVAYLEAEVAKLNAQLHN
uniref:Coronin n=1 Tax=Arcella intermedia TaxID=1963864 RepID=A0A6B2L4A8_9EUKA